MWYDERKQSFRVYLRGEIMEKKKKGVIERIWEVVRDALGFYRNPPYVADYMREANVRSAAYMSFVVIALELWMVVRYIDKYVLAGKVKDIGEFFYWTKSYWIFMGCALAVFIYSLMYLSGKIKRYRQLSNLWTVGLGMVCLYFGMITSFSDFEKGKMITCFLTMVMYAGCLLIWRPYISVIMLTAIAAGFRYWINTAAVGRDGSPLQLGDGDTINYQTYFISLTMVAISIYYQRHREAKKAHSLELAMVTDDVTGLPNMRRFRVEASEYVKKAVEEGRHPVYIFFNVENFQTYNDRNGYEAGNVFLKEIGQIITRNFPGEPVARDTEDHFAVLTCREDFEDRVKAVREAVKVAEKGEIYLDMKAGTLRPTDVDADPVLELNKCRHACYLLKNHEEDAIKEYDEKLDKNYRLRQYVLNNIDKAVREGYIKVYYQPVVWADDGMLCGCEALAKWDDPDMGFLSPGVFIPVLEECRQIHKLDRCIYNTVCRRMRECLDAGLPVVPVSLNFSRLDFELMDVVAELEGLIEKYNIPRDYLHVEITESALTDNMSRLQESMNILHDKGYSIWLDDFGSGYSSMNVLKDYRFDLLKVDMVFLRNFSGNENARKIVKSILDLAKSLNMMTLTEGVETEEAVEFLQEAGCGRLQGYFYGKPMVYEDILKKIEDGTYRLSDKYI